MWLLKWHVQIVQSQIQWKETEHTNSVVSWSLWMNPEGCWGHQMGRSTPGSLFQTIGSEQEEVPPEKPACCSRTMSSSLLKGNGRGVGGISTIKLWNQEEPWEDPLCSLVSRILVFVLFWPFHQLWKSASQQTPNMCIAPARSVPQGVS